MWNPFKKRKKVRIAKKKVELGPKGVSSKGIVETVLFSYIDDNTGVRYTGVGDVTVPSDMRLSDYLVTNEKVSFIDVKLENGECFNELGLKLEDLIFVAFGMYTKPKIKESHPIEFILGGYGLGYQNTEKVSGDVVLLNRNDLKRKLRGAIIAVRNFKRDGEVYPAALISTGYIHDRSKIAK